MRTTYAPLSYYYKNSRKTPLEERTNVSEIERDGEQSNRSNHPRKHNKQIRGIQHKRGSDITYLPSPLPIRTTGLCRQYAPEYAQRGPTCEMRHESKLWTPPRIDPTLLRGTLDALLSGTMRVGRSCWDTRTLSRLYSVIPLVSGGQDQYWLA